MEFNAIHILDYFNQTSLQYNKINILNIKL